MKKLFSRETVSKIFLFFMFFSAFLDLHIVYNSFSTLVRLVVIGFLFSVSFFCFSDKKDRIKLVIYFSFSLLYSLFHLLNIDNYVVQETLYIVKMLSNVLIFYTVYSINLTYDKIIKPVKGILWFISGSILVCNLLKIGYSSYSFENIKYNIFDWFSEIDDYFIYFAGKGYFHLANQVIGVVLLFMPLLINEIKNKKSIYDVLLLNICSLAMLIIGNRTASTVPLVILIASLLLYLFMLLIKKEKFDIKYILILVFSILFIIVFLFNSPILKRESFYDGLGNEYVDENASESGESDNVIIAEDNTRDYLVKNNLNINFIDNYYPYSNDMQFWDNLRELDINYADSRLIETLIAERLVELSDNKSDKYLGIGYYTIIKVCNVERDYVMQYYSIGILGLLVFIGWYFVILFYIIFKVFADLKSKFTYLNVMLVMGICLDLLSAYLSGNMLNALSSTIPLCIVFGVAFNEVKNSNTPREDNNI